MPTRDEIIKILHEKLPYLNAEYGVRRIGLFGSYARGSPKKSSDLDLVVEFDHPIGLKFIELGDYLEELSGVRVDMLTPDGVRHIWLESVAQHITGEIFYV